MNYSSDILTMIMGSGPVVTAVLLTLVSFSLISWTIIVAKFFRFRTARKRDMEFLNFFSNSDSFEKIEQKAFDIPDAPVSQVFLAGYSELKRLYSEFSRATSPVPLAVWLETLERSLDKASSAEISKLSKAVPVLATIGNAAPFIGLFGTVWGIMSSFQSIGIRGSATLATVAPGISEALVATAAGLAAAIPAVMAFNTFMSGMEGFERELRGFSGDFLNSVERQLAARGIH
jgi:biopolymer transport protein TolQ